MTQVDCELITLGPYLHKKKKKHFNYNFKTIEITKKFLPLRVYYLSLLL